MNESDLFELTTKQRQAFNRMKKAHTDCVKLGILFYNNYGSLGAVDSEKITRYDDQPEGIPDDMQNSSNEFDLRCGEWADDSHYFHIRENENT